MLYMSSFLILYVTEYQSKERTHGSCSKSSSSSPRGDRFLEEHTQRFVDLIHLHHYDDDILCVFFQARLNTQMKARLLGDGPQGTFIEYVDLDLLRNGSHFTRKSLPPSLTICVSQIPQVSHRSTSTMDFWAWSGTFFPLTPFRAAYHSGFWLCSLMVLPTISSSMVPCFIEFSNLFISLLCSPQFC